MQTAHPLPVQDGDPTNCEIGKAVRVNPIKLTLQAPGNKRMKLKYGELLTDFAFKFNLRRYISATAPSSSSSCPTRFPSRSGWGGSDCLPIAYHSKHQVQGLGFRVDSLGLNRPKLIQFASDEVPVEIWVGARGLHSSTFRLNISSLYEIGGAFKGYCIGC